MGKLGVIAMLGASNALPEDALQCLDGKRVRIFVHDDRSGRIGAERWAAQLLASGVHVDGFSFAGCTRVDGGRVKDLNDFAHIHPAEFEARHTEIEEAFGFVAATDIQNVVKSAIDLAEAQRLSQGISKDARAGAISGADDTQTEFFAHLIPQVRRHLLCNKKWEEL
jgi:hypothetical protein